MSEEMDISQFNMEIISAASYLHPDKPEELASRNLAPYFKDLGMNEENIVPGGLREYTAEVMHLLDLSPTIENLQTMLKLPEVEATLRSAITAASKTYEANKQLQTGNLDNIKGVNTETMQELTKLAQAEQLQKEAQQFSENIVQEEKQEESEPEEEEPETPTISPPASTEAAYCPRCGWDISKQYTTIQPTEDDKIQFVYSIMQRTPFEKTFPLFDGKIQITFRSKTAEDDNVILAQLRRDLNEDLYNDPSSVTFYSNLYELVLLLVRIDSPTPKDAKAIIKPEYKEFADKKNGLREYMHQVTEQYIGTEALLRLISEHYRTFSTLYKALIDEAVSENFYSPA